jgi:hypothetical protein
MVICSIVMFLSDMSGRSPLYKKYVQHILPVTFLIDTCFGFIFFGVLLVLQGICVFQFSRT